MSILKLYLWFGVGQFAVLIGRLLPLQSAKLAVRSMEGMTLQLERIVANYPVQAAIIADRSLADINRITWSEKHEKGLVDTLADSDSSWVYIHDQARQDEDPFVNRLLSVVDRLMLVREEGR